MDVVIGLGSNLGDRLALLRAAAGELGERLRPVADRGAASPRWGVPMRVRRSRVVESAAAGGPPQGPYYNAALWLRTDLGPHALLAMALEVERALGRVRPEPVRWGPRLIDVDILWIRDLVIDDPDLQVPHPRLRARPFALQPLAEVAPEAIDPADGARYVDLARAMASLPVVATL